LKIAVFSDAHSNIHALEAVLADIRRQKPDAMVCLGDTVGYASQPAACVARVRELGCPVVLGNHDEAVFSEADPAESMNHTAVAGIRHSRHQLTEDDLDWLRALPMDVKTSEAAFTHASLCDDYPWLYVLDHDDAERHFLAQRKRICFCGHTHRPGVWIKEPGEWIAFKRGEGTVALPKTGKVLINAGSVGQPRDGDPRACYAMFHVEEKKVEFRRVEYNVEAAVLGILRAKLPRFTAERLVGAV